MATHEGDAGQRRSRGTDEDRDGDLPGIVIADRSAAAPRERRAPRISAFIWGGKVRPTPTLPYGRWKGVA